MKFEPVTIKDIAKALKLSTSTVSRALSDSYQISPKTKKVVAEYAAKINYQPNPIAQSLKVRKSHTIAVVVSELANSFFSQVIDGVDTLAHEKGYNVIIAQSHEKFDIEESILKYLSGRSVDGIIISVSLETKDFSFLKELKQRGMPIVFVDRIANDLDTHKVILNNYKASYDATTYLIKKGYRRIAALASVVNLSITQERLAGYMAALNDNRISINNNYIRHCKPGATLGQEIAKVLSYFQRLKQKPDAVIGLSDKLTTGMLREMVRQKIKIPEEMAIMGFSNNDLTELFSPPLSIIKQPAFEMGKVATELLIRLIESKRPVTEFITKILEPEHIIRESVIKGKR